MSDEKPRLLGIQKDKVLVGDLPPMTEWRDRLRVARSRFAELFGVVETPWVATAPGRVNLIGEHTDYNGGWVLPMAIDRSVWGVFSPGRPGYLKAHSVLFGETRECRFDALDSVRGSHWFSYVAGMVWVLLEAGHRPLGINIVIDGDVPMGSGLSSSAALEMMIGSALIAVSDLSLLPLTMARLGQKAENEFVGVQCGIMDQLISAAAQPGAALLIDCRSLEIESVGLPQGASIVVMDSGASRELASSAYNSRRASCEAVVAAIGKQKPSIRSLRDVDLSRLELVRNEVGNLNYRRALHVLHETQRPLQLARSFRESDLERAGVLLNESHESLRDLYGVSSPELDRLTELARLHPHCYGARLTGAGFGGCAIALVEDQHIDSFVDQVLSAYRSDFALESHFFTCYPVGGARSMAAIDVLTPTTSKPN